MRELLELVVSEVRSAWRFRWYAVVTTWGVGLLGLAAVAWLPDIYEASARVYVDATSELTPLLTDRIVAPRPWRTAIACVVIACATPQSAVRQSG